MTRPDPAQPPMRLAALVVTCDRPAQLAVTVSRLLSEPVDHVLVVNNSRQPETGDWLESQDNDRLITLDPGNNLGGAGGFALGMETLRQGVDPDWIVLMDDDARPLPGTMAAFRRMKHGTARAYAGAVHYPDGRICEMNRPLRNPFQSPRRMLTALGRRGGGRFRVSDTAYGRDASPQAVDMSSFVGFFVSREAIDTVGLPDPRLFLYGDDLLYTLRLSQAGLGLVFAPALRFEHDCQTLSAGPRTYRPTWKAYYNYRNGILLYRATAGPLAWPLMALRIPGWFAAARRYGDEAPAYRRLLRAAVRDGLTRRLDQVPPGVPGPSDGGAEDAAREDRIKRDKPAN